MTEEPKLKKPYVRYKCQCCGESMGIGIYVTDDEIPFAFRFCEKCYLAHNTVKMHIETNRSDEG